MVFQNRKGHHRAPTPIIGIFWIRLIINTYLIQYFYNFVRQLASEDSIKVTEFESKIESLEMSELRSLDGKWLKLSVKLDGLHPVVSRDLLVSPDLSMRALHEVVLCPGKCRHPIASESKHGKPVANIPQLYPNTI